MHYNLNIKLRRDEPLSEDDEKTLWAIFDFASTALVRTAVKLFGLVEAGVTPTKYEIELDTTVNELLLLVPVDEDEDEEENVLDEAVRVAAEAAADTVNSQGYEAQIRYLVEELGVDAARKIVEATRQ